MKCPKCQGENEAGAKFCEECGAPLARVCAKCGRQLPPTAKFCPECAHPTGLVPGTPAVTRFASPETYTPKHLAEKILTSKSSIEGERKQVTALFADLKGSMELFADRDSEEACKLLDPVLEHMMEAVHRYEGTTHRVMGDGIMALFGAPLAHEDHGVRACYAALRMQETVKRYAEGVRRIEGIPIQIRVGLNSGEVVVRSIGSDLRMDYSAVGQTLNVAARMEQMAVPGSILISADTLALAEGFVQVKPLGPMKVKGLELPLEVYEVLGASAVRTRLQASVARGLTRFVGREAELEQLRRAQMLAADGHGQVVAIMGEAGLGKSRLVWEFTHSQNTRNWLVREAASVSYGKATTYLPVIELLKSYFQIEPRDDARKIREKLTNKILSLDRALDPTLPVLLSLLDIPVDDPEWTKLDPPQRRRQTLDALKLLLLRESQVQPLLLVFEDLHWIDSETQALLDSLVDGVPTARVLALVSYRPEYTHGWGSKTYYRQLRIDPLPPESADELLDALLGTDVVLGPLKRLLIERTGANPLFLEESVRALVETGALVGERGGYRLTHPVEQLNIPANVQALLAARIDRLAPEDKRLLQAAAVVGKDVPFVLLQATFGDESGGQLPFGLDRLQAAEFLYETQLFPELEYTFKHALTHDVTYGGLLREQRRTLHARIVEAMERLYADRLPEQAERLAQHALRGEVWDKAVKYCWQAGVKAAARSAHREAVASFEQALDALPHLPEKRTRHEQAIDLRFDLRNALLPLGEQQRIINHLREAESLAVALDDQRRLGRVFSFMTHYFNVREDLDRALEVGQRAFVISETLGDFALQVETQFHLGRLYYVLGDYWRAIAVIKKNVEALQGALKRERFGLPGLASALSCDWLARSLGELGAFDEGMAYADEAIRTAEEVDHSFTLIAAYHSAGLLCLRKGELPKALSLLERCLALVQSRNVPYLFGMTAACLSSAYALSGQVGQALPLLDQVMKRFESGVHWLWVAELSETYLLTGHIDRILPLVGRALERSPDLKERGHQAWLLRLLAEIAALRDPPEAEQAKRHYRHALALATQLGMRPLVAHCNLGLCKLYRQTGQREQAHEPLTTATTMYREMNMQFWLQKAEAEMRQLG